MSNLRLYRSRSASSAGMAVGGAIRAAPLILLVLIALHTSAAAQGPGPPCGGPPQPPYPALGEPERSGIWTTSELGQSWAPPLCTGWTGTDFRLLVSVAARI